MDSDSGSVLNNSRNPLLPWLALLFAVIGIALTATRTYQDYAPPTREFTFEKMGLFDFHNGGYFPALAFREGVNPYSAEMSTRYEVPRPAPAYSPVVFFQHLPFSLLPLKSADVVYFLFNLGLIGLLAYWSITMSKAPFSWVGWMAILGLFVFSRPGHLSLYTGYFTAQLVIGTVLALHFAKSKPMVSGLGMLLASGKPTYIIPLMILMLFRKNYKALAIGLAMCAAVVVLGVGWLASFSSVSEVVDGMRHGQDAFHQDSNEDPANTWTRLDLVGMVAKVINWKPGNKVYLIFMLGLLVLPCLAIWKAADRESNSGATGLTAMIACLAILVTIYHHSYDSMLIAIPWIGVTFFGKRVCPEMSKSEHRILAVLLGIPAINYASTLKFRNFFQLENHADIWNVITSINGACLLLALLLLIGVAFRFADPKPLPVDTKQRQRPKKEGRKTELSSCPRGAQQM